MGCVATWPVTVPKQCSHREVELPTLPVEDLLNPCSEAHVAEVKVIDRFDSVASVFCMTMRVTNTPLMMQDNCMCHLNLNRLLSMERLRWKIRKTQKTEKDLCQCGCK